jgi:hypothetical protein
MRRPPYIGLERPNHLRDLWDKLRILLLQLWIFPTFGLINAGETFQRAMDVAFWGLINKCVVVYLDDVTVYSKNREDHIQHLTQIFERCRKYGISLNPKKTILVSRKVNY